MRPRVISLFSGAGGLDYGLEAAGFETAAALEMNADCCATLRVSRPRWRVIEDDIMNVSSEKVLETAGVRAGEVELLVGGPPCQPFSKAGYWSRGDALRLDDPRANTLAAYMRVVEDTLPAVFVLENVEGLAYEGKDEGLTFLLDRIDQINRRTKSRFTPVVSKLNFAEYGVPQLRERVLVVAARDGSTFRFPSPTHAADPEPGLLPGTGMPRFRTAWDALADVRPEPNEDLQIRGKWAGLLPSIPEGANYLHHTERGQGEPLFGWRRRFWTFLLKLAKARPSWTLQAQPGPAVGPFHWHSRRLSMRELCRLQTFPDDVLITGGRTAVQRQVGNAVPSLMAEVLGRSIAIQLLGRSPLRQPFKLLPPDRGAPPPPEPTRPVPRELMKLAGQHAPHPGTGKGYGAKARNRSEVSA
jgi:DNA (cytosine-5)-methyltransferase 1